MSKTFFINRFNNLSKDFRRERHKYFLTYINKIKKPITIIDLGGTAEYWRSVHFIPTKDVQLFLFNKTNQKCYSKYMFYIFGDANELFNIKDKQFDLVFSNSLIEHLKSKSKQKLFSREVQRIGNYYFIQTPNKFFPLEPHYLLPFIQFLPKQLQIILIYLVSPRFSFFTGKQNRLSLIKYHIDTIRLLTKEELIAMFDRGFLYEEKFLFFSKSFTIKTR